MNEKRKLTVGSCFSGIGGLELGLEWTGGFETKWQIENDAYASAVLAKHWPDVQRFTDIRDVVRPPAVDLICGGFPCQDVSLAGRRSGLRGKRTTLWGEMFRLVCEVKPRWVLAENVPGLLSSDDGQFFGNILRDLAGEGFDVEWGMLSAKDVGAPHLRRRIFILANTESNKEWGAWETSGEQQKQIRGRSSQPETILADSKSQQSGRIQSGGFQRDIRASSNSICDTTITGLPDWSGGEMGQPKPITEFERSDGREIECDFRGVAYGVSRRVDRLRCLGNAVVPQVAQKVGEMILNFEGVSGAGESNG